jgi:hypothetical protein
MEVFVTPTARFIAFSNFFALASRETTSLSTSVAMAVTPL